MRVLFATAELSPIARVVGLAEASAGLVRALRDLDIEVEVVLPDYEGRPLDDEEQVSLPVPDWAAPAVARRGRTYGAGEVTLIRAPGIDRPHPYLQADGNGWPDNDERFMRFSAAVAALATLRGPDVLHLNDWHTAAALGFLAERPPTVLTIHTLGYQGWADHGWLQTLPFHRDAYDHNWACNPLAGGIRLADLIVAVSPTYAQEILTPEGGAGLDHMLRLRAEHVVGIRNGIDATVWDPATDPHLPAAFTPKKLDGKAATRRALLEELGWPDDDAVLLVAVTRLVEQKGIDVLLEAVPFLAGMPARLAVLGDGDRWLADGLRDAAAAHPDTVAFRQGYDAGLSHRLFGGGDVLVMPSRFEPCGLAQMQAMRYGTIPVVTDVGGLHDTVLDADSHPASGTGFVAPTAEPLALLDALHRAARAVRVAKRRDPIRRRGMTTDWSWRAPAEEHVRCYEGVVNARSSR